MGVRLDARGRMRRTSTGFQSAFRLLRFLTAVVLSGCLLSVAAAAQDTRTTVHVGLLDNGVPDTRQHLWDAFERQMRQLGYVDGQNVTYERRWAHGRAEQLPSLARELVERRVSVLVTAGSTATNAARAATATIPIVFASTSDPIGLRYVANLANPGGNVTGFSNLNQDLGGPRLELLKAILPTMSRVAVLADAASTSSALQAEEIQRAGQALGISTEIVKFRRAEEFDGTFDALAANGVDALIFVSSSMLFSHRERLAKLALQKRLPVVAPQREWAEAGMLATYGPNLADAFRRAAGYVHRILTGTRLSDLPVEQPATFEILINLKTAHAVGVTVPPHVLVRADEVIE